MEQTLLEKHIIGQKVVAMYWKQPYKDYYGFITEYENGYKTACFGGGCSGNDCNSMSIITPEGEEITYWNEEN